MKREVERFRARLRECQRERQLVSYEIHDGLLQSVIAAHMVGQTLQRKWRGTMPGEEPVELTQLLDYLQQAMTEGRWLIEQLQPEPLGAEGLTAAIGSLTRSAAHGGREMQIELEIDIPDPLEPLIQLTIYRVIQEALNNVRRHSDATCVRIEARHANQNIHLLVSDNGRGFDPLAVPTNHFGLKGIRRRVQLLGGQVQIHSAAGKGTQVIANLPARIADRIVESEAKRVDEPTCGSNPRAS
jgi:signal transduction histidine kinase